MSTTKLSPLATMVRSMLGDTEHVTSARKLWNEAPRGVSRASIDTALAELYDAGYLGSNGVGFERVWGRSDAKAAEFNAQRAFMKAAVDALAAKGVTVERADNVRVTVNMHNLYRLMNALHGTPPDVTPPALFELFKAANGNDPAQYSLTPGEADSY